MSLFSIQLFTKGLKNLPHDPVNAYQLYQAGRYLTSILISIFLVKSGLTGDEVGHFELLLFIAVTVSFFWTVGIQNALVSYYPTIHEGDQLKTLQTVFLILVLIGFVLGLIVLVFPQWVIGVFKSEGRIDSLPLVALFVMVSAPLLMIENILLLRKQSTSIIRYTIISLSATILLIGSIAMSAPEVKNFLLCLIAVAALRLVYLLYLLDIFKGVMIEKKVFITFFIFAMPLIFNTLISSLMDIVDGWFVSRYFSAADFAVFRYGARELPFSNVLYSSLSVAMIPFLGSGTSSLTVLKSKATKWMHILFPVSIVLMFISPLLFSGIFNPSYKTSAFIFNIYLLILTSRVLLPQAYNFAKHQHKVIIWSGILELICNILLSYWWMHIWGMYGLALATVVAYFIQKAILIVYNRTYNGIPFSSYIEMKYYLIYSMLSIFALYLSFRFFV